MNPELMGVYPEPRREAVLAWALDCVKLVLMAKGILKKSGLVLALIAICVIMAHACVHFGIPAHQDNQDNCCLCHTVLSSDVAPVIASISAEPLGIFRQIAIYFVFQEVTRNESSRSPPSV